MKIKKILSAILVFAMILTMLPANLVFAEDPVEPDLSIFTLTELKAFRDAVNAGNTYKDKTVRLADNINIGDEYSKTTKKSWEPIGLETAKFEGTFDGNNKTISGLYIEYGALSYDGQGLFGYTGEYATVKNLIVNGYVGSLESNIGGIVGVNAGLITSCRYDGDIYSASYYSGGIAGCNNGTVQYCTNNGGSLKSVGYYLGGIVGNNYGTIKYCSNSSDLYINYCGAGIAAYINKDTVIENCYNLGDIYDFYSDYGTSYCGGIVGLVFNGITLKNCFSYGIVKNKGVDNGYVIGYYRHSDLKIENVYYLNSDLYNNTEIYTSTKGTALTADEFKSGKYAYLLNGRKCEGELVWGQMLTGDNADLYPVFNNGSNTVYTTEPCAIEYSNTRPENSIKQHDFENGVCKNCGEADPIPLTDENGAYLIKTKSQLYWFADLVNGNLTDYPQNTSANAILQESITLNDNVLNDDYTLKNAIDFYDKWEPLSLYKGTFDGNGHAIKGLVIEKGYIQGVGFIANLEENGSVKI